MRDRVAGSLEMHFCIAHDNRLHAISQTSAPARGLDRDDFKQCLVAQCKQLLLGDQVRLDFQAEMSRFIPRHIQERTIDTPEYWPYIQTTIQELVDQICAEM